MKRDSRFRLSSPPSSVISSSSVIRIKRTTTISTPSSSMASISSRPRCKAQKLITENLPSSPEIPMISPHRTMLSPEIPVLSLPPPPPPPAYPKRFTRPLPSKSLSSTTTSTKSTLSSLRSNAPHVTDKTFLIPPPIPSSSKPRLSKPLPPRSASSAKAKEKAKETLRQALQRQWTAAARADGAAPIYFVNEVDDEEVPPQLVDFCYMESKYCSEEVNLECEPYFFASCGCGDCKKAEICDCQAVSELRDKKGKRTFAYDKEGLFKFIVNPGVEVVECNRFCKCDIETCPNRVAQRPRDIPIEVFKTGTCGWGVRPTIKVKRGKVVGIYTGLLMTRRTADALANDLKAYCFALDGHEAPGEETVENTYSVVSQVCGNWTRFINHSCSPNLEVYMVVYETISEMNMPYLAFVATEDIPARTEFTVDYDPAAPIAAVDKKGRFKIPEGARKCKCLSKACRGYVRA
ncbi:hypothetical protein BDQ12DRAFT_689322 [Crucibulum laeve]|uniref:SET domain-containing protein n=1 Tax=Crucibulum laeve TaxID=68775 RepID=A0A5C3M0X6_9AGAR|nr:hypothetical protein BDQ12DRAFT_689322 [Crucibulum laeve]